MKMKQSVFKNACEMKSLEELLQFGTETAFHGQLSATEIPVLPILVLLKSSTYPIGLHALLNECP